MLTLLLALYTAAPGALLDSADVYAYRSVEVPGVYEVTVQVSTRGLLPMFGQAGASFGCQIESDVVTKPGPQYDELDEAFGYDGDLIPQSAAINVHFTARLQVERYLMVTCTGPSLGYRNELTRVYLQRVR